MCAALQLAEPFHLNGAQVAYKPKITPLIDLANRTPGWTAVTGIQMLLEQGYWQSQFWTTRRPPKTVIAAAVLEAYERDMK